MPITYNPFESEHGFKSTGFTVDDQGNITARSLSFTIAAEDETETDYAFSESGASQFRETGNDPDNPSLTLLRGVRYTIALTLSTLNFNISNEDGSALYNTGVSHTTTNNVTTTGASAQGKSTGIVTFDVPIDAPAALRYTNSTGAPFGQIAISDPVITGNGSFNTLTVAGNMNALGADASIRLQPTGQGSVNISASTGSIEGLAITTPSITSTSGLIDVRPQDNPITLIARGSGIVTIDSGTVGSINNINIGNNVPATGSFSTLEATSGTLNGINIGATTPGTGAFTTASVTQSPTTTTGIANKRYVDENVTALAIALGS